MLMLMVVVVMVVMMVMAMAMVMVILRRIEAAIIPRITPLFLHHRRRVSMIYCADRCSPEEFILRPRCHLPEDMASCHLSTLVLKADMAER
jgi:hypothetical protein